MEVEKLINPEDPELKKKKEELLRAMTIKRYHYILCQIYSRLKNKKYSLKDLQDEIEHKKSPLTASQREFVMTFNIDFIEDLLRQMYKPRQLNGIVFTTSKEN